jgi:hypothetical protein
MNSFTVIALPRGGEEDIPFGLSSAKAQAWNYLKDLDDGEILELLAFCKAVKAVKLVTRNLSNS